jgi:IclR family transcriptional regulator, pca regulon regulatory protein
MASTVQSVERAFAVLEAFDEDHPSRSAAEIAEVAGLARPTTYRLLQTLQQLGYIRSHRGRYEVTPRVLRLGAGYLGRRSLAALVQPILDQLSEEIGEHVAVGVLDGDHVITIAASNSPQSRLLAIAVQVGQRLPARTTALGRVLLASLPEHRHDPELAEIRARGYEVNDGMLETGLRAIGVPIQDRRGNTVASMSIAVNASRVTLDDLRGRCLPGLRRAVDVLADQLTPDVVAAPTS